SGRPRFRLVQRLHQAAEKDFGDFLRALFRIGIGQVAETGHRKMLLRKTQEFGTISAPGAAVADGREAAIVADEQSFGVFEDLAVGQLSPLLQLGDEILSSNLSGVK